MRGLLLATAVLVLAAGALAGGYSLGYKQMSIPAYVGTEWLGDIYMTTVHMFRFGAAASPEFRVEALLGYSKYSVDYGDTVGTEEYEASLYALGGSGYYVIAEPANTVASIGGSFVYVSSSSESDGVDGPSTSGFVITPVLRVDFAIPGAERFALFTEYGIKYASLTTEYSDNTEDDYSGYQIYGPPNVLAGAYYSF
ncbi:hypothetical protein GF402_02835 [Candidatus Fermentibacteria bacterium]|nr:hypothetical protein [Candidatus Fermentibacteria bacterium]